MNPAYTQVRFRAIVPHGELPESFGIVTAWNPDGMIQEGELNAAANDDLRASLDFSGLKYFAVTGGSPDFSHFEPGFGILADKATILEIGRRYRQEAVFWVEGGTVHVVSCSVENGQKVGYWTDLAQVECAQS